MIEYTGKSAIFVEGQNYNAFFLFCHIMKNTPPFQSNNKIIDTIIHEKGTHLTKHHINVFYDELMGFGMKNMQATQK